MGTPNQDSGMPMKPNTYHIIATLMLAATMAGCSGTTPSANAPIAATISAARTVPVFIIPNCQVLDGERQCMWIEPRGYHSEAPAPAVTSAKRVNGIAL